ncbi:MAG: ATP-binding protein [Rickettsiales bacterium]|nr:ATP-binding protein [Rickettsiales bacterium]
MSTSISIRPESGVYKVFKHLKYKPWYALAEFVDNSLQSFISKNGKFGETRPYCLVEINCDPNNKIITIEDNSYGIAESEHQRAFTAGRPPEDTSGLSEFGVGMKSAGIWFSPNWTVTTCSLDSSKIYQYKFILDDLTSSDGELVPFISEAVANKGFTKIELKELHQSIKGRTLGKIKDHLRSIYRCFLRDGSLVLMFNGEKLAYEEQRILTARKSWESIDHPDNKSEEWKKSINFTFGNNMKVSGFAAILETGSVRNAGFSLFRRNRLILGSDDEKYRPEEVFGQTNSYEYQRIFGEFYLNGVDVSHTKDDINFGEYEEEFLDKLREAVNSDPLPLIKQAKTYRSRQLTNKAIAEFEKATKEVTKTFQETLGNSSQNTEALIESHGNKDYDVHTQSANYIDSSQAKLATKIEKISSIPVSIRDIDFNFQIKYERNDNSLLYKIEYADDESRSVASKIKNLVIVISQDHELCINALDGSNRKLTDLLLMIITLVITEVLLTVDGNNFARFISKGFNEQLAVVTNTVKNYVN